MAKGVKGSHTRIRGHSGSIQVFDWKGRFWTVERTRHSQLGNDILMVTSSRKRAIRYRSALMRRKR